MTKVPSCTYPFPYSLPLFGKELHKRKINEFILEWQIVLKAGARVHAEQKFIYQHQSEISSEMIVANE